MRRPHRAWTAASMFACLIAAQTATAQPIDNLIKHDPGDNDVLIRDAADIPPLLQDALKRLRGCTLAGRVLSELPIITFEPTPGSPPMTLVPCESHVLHSQALLYERGLTGAPTQMKFPFSLLIWDAKAKELIGYRFTDLVTTPWYVGRDIYRHVGGTELNGFARVGQERGEVTQYGVKNWQPIEQMQPGDAPRR